MRRGPLPGSDPAAGFRTIERLPPPEAFENKIAAQVAEIERLAEDNRRLAATHGALRQDFVAAQQEAQRIKAHIRNIQTESDIQIRVLLDKTAKMEADIRIGENVKKDLQQAHLEVRGLITARQELAAQIQQAALELQKARSDVKNLPEMHDELDSLRQEHQRLRATFEFEKGLNIEQVERMQAMEKNLIGMAREAEKLRAEVLKAENRAHAPNPYGRGYAYQDPSYPTPTLNTVPYIDVYGRPLVQMDVVAAGDGMIPHGSSALSGSGGGSVWGGAYDHELGRR